MFLHNTQDPHAPKTGPWEYLDEEIHEEIDRAFADLPHGYPRTHGEAIATIRNASITWLERKNHETGHEHLIILELTTNDGNGTVIAGTNHHPDRVQPDPSTWAWMMNANHRCEIWHNHPHDIEGKPHSAWLSANDISALGCPGVQLVAAINGAGDRCAVQIHTHENLTAGKMLTWLSLVQDTAEVIIEKHEQQGTGGQIDPAEAVAWAGAEAGLYTIVLEPSTLRRADIVNEILTHPDVASAPPAHEQKETSYAGLDRTTQTSMGTTRHNTCGPDLSW